MEKGNFSIIIATTALILMVVVGGYLLLFTGKQATNQQEEQSQGTDCHDLRSAVRKQQDTTSLSSPTFLYGVWKSEKSFLMNNGEWKPYDTVQPYEFRKDGSMCNEFTVDNEGAIYTCLKYGTTYTVDGDIITESNVSGPIRCYTWGSAGEKLELEQWSRGLQKKRVPFSKYLLSRVMQNPQKPDVVLLPPTPGVNDRIPPKIVSINVAFFVDEITTLMKTEVSCRATDENALNQVFVGYIPPEGTPPPMGIVQWLGAITRDTDPKNQIWKGYFVHGKEKRGYFAVCDAVDKGGNAAERVFKEFSFP